MVEILFARKSDVDFLLAGSVTSVFGRAGAIVGAAGDYSASLITNVPSGNIAAVTVQGALDELDTDKLAASAYTAADVLAKLLTVDGSGSLLDADFLDGNSAAAFAAAAHTHSAADITSGTLAAARMPALTGDITTSVGAVATTLATVNGNVGTFGTASAVSRPTVNAKGLVTAIDTVAIAIASTAVTDFTEAVQDVAGALFIDSTTLDFTYSDAGGTLTAEVLNDAVTNAKLANMAAWTVKVRNAGTTGDPSDAALADVTEETVPAAGDFMWVWLNSGEIRKVNWDKLPSASGVADGDKGDITVSGSGTVWTIDPDVVTYAKMQNVSATDKVLGRSTAGAGDVEEIAFTAAARALVDDADAGAMRTTLLAAARTQVDDLNIFIENPADQDYKVVVNSSFGYTINEITTICLSGTCTVTGKINTTALGGTANAASTSEQTQAHASANVLAVADDFRLTISANASCADLSIKVKRTRSLD